MANSLPTEISKQVKEVVYKKADEHGYGSRTRIDNSAFLDALVEESKPKQAWPERKRMSLIVRICCPKYCGAEV
jgi:hypothetical protein